MVIVQRGWFDNHLDPLEPHERELLARFAKASDRGLEFTGVISPEDMIAIYNLYARGCIEAVAGAYPRWRYRVTPTGIRRLVE